MRLPRHLPVTRRDFLRSIGALACAAAGAGLSSPAAADGGPVLLAQGRFRDADFMHRGAGDVRVFRRDNGSAFLRFENFRVTPGPDLYVVLVRHPDPENARQVRGDGSVYVGMLKATEGAQEYELPAGTKVADFGSVVVYCKIFDVLFAPASLSKVSR